MENPRYNQGFAVRKRLEKGPADKKKVDSRGREYFISSATEIYIKCNRNYFGFWLQILLVVEIVFENIILKGLKTFKNKNKSFILE